MRRSRLVLSKAIPVLLCASLILCVKAEDAMWAQTYTRSDYGRGFSLVEDSDGGYVLAGAIGNIQEYSADCWLVKTDEFGNVEWNQTYEGIGADWAYSLVNTSDGGYALAGVWNCSSAFLFADYYYTSPVSSGDFWLVKTDLLGNMEWNQTYGGDYFDYAYSLVATSDGGYALAGSYYNASGLNGHDDFLLVKTDSLGNMEWNRTYGGEGVDEAYSLLEASDGGYAIAGCTTSFGAGYADFWLVKTGANGNVEWDRTYGGGGVDYADSLVATSDGGYAILGTYGFPAHEVWVGHYNFWLVKTDELGAIPEDLTISVMLLLSTVAAIVGIRYLHKRPKWKRW